MSDLAERRRGPWVVITIRTDFLDRAAGHLAFARHLKEALFLVTPLEDHEVRDVIVRPASAVGATVEPDLVAAAVRDVANRAIA